ncbi:hypothetical protein CR513_21533, partial [Mucuna pruriens]
MVSTPHIYMKYPIGGKVRTVRADQHVACWCYGKSLKVGHGNQRQADKTTNSRINKKRKLGKEKRKEAKEETNKLLAAHFISKVRYPTWLANMVMMRKSSGKWRMCTNYTDLNKAFLKDPYPLLNID